MLHNIKRWWNYNWPGLLVVGLALAITFLTIALISKTEAADAAINQHQVLSSENLPVDAWESINIEDVVNSTQDNLPIILVLPRFNSMTQLDERGAMRVDPFSGFVEKQSPFVQFSCDGLEYRPGAGPAYMDFICHGFSSPEWQDFTLGYVEIQNGLRHGGYIVGANR